MEGCVFLTEINEYGMSSCLKTTQYSSLNTKQAPNGARFVRQNAHLIGWVYIVYSSTYPGCRRSPHHTKNGISYLELRPFVYTVEDIGDTHC